MGSSGGAAAGDIFDLNPYSLTYNLVARTAGFKEIRAGQGDFTGSLTGDTARRAAKAQADEQKRQFDQLAGSLASQNEAAGSTAAADAARRSARKRQLAAASGGTGRQDTILTQGLGTVSTSAGQQKTILGA